MSWGVLCYVAFSSATVLTWNQRFSLKSQPVFCWLFLQAPFTTSAPRCWVRLKLVVQIDFYTSNYLYTTNVNFCQTANFCSEMVLAKHVSGKNTFCSINVDRTRGKRILKSYIGLSRCHLTSASPPAHPAGFNGAVHLSGQKDNVGFQQD